MTNARSGTSKRMITGNTIEATRVCASVPRCRGDPLRTDRLRDGESYTESDELDGDEKEQT